MPNWKRRNRAPRCDDCGLHVPLCVCDDMPRVGLDTHVVLVQHAQELQRPTNTGRLALNVLRNSSATVFGRFDRDFDPGPLDHPGREPLLLFPREDAVPLTPELVSEGGRDRALVILDGTWAQCSRMTRRLPVLEAMRCVSLPESDYAPGGIRRQSEPGRLTTLDAVIRLIALLGSAEDAVAVRAWYQEHTARLLFMKGMLREPVVPTGWPDPAQGLRASGIG